MFDYPNPCDTCEEKCSNCYHCQRWRMRFLTVWKQFNSYQIRQFKRQRVKKTNSFTYEHPDLVKKYLQTSPCKNCEYEADCDTPCTGYYAWLDARMFALRAKYNGERM